MNIRQIARDFARKHVFECELLEEGLPIPVIPVEDEILHTVDHPFCDDPKCPCFEPYGPTWMEYLHIPFDGGLLTQPEAQALIEGTNI